MDRAGINSALVHHTLAAQWDPAEGNSALLHELEGRDRLLPCFIMLPEATREMPPASEVATLARFLHGAARVFPQSHGFALADRCMGSALQALDDAGVPLVVDVGQTDWASLDALLSSHPSLPVILLDASYRCDRYLYPLWERHPNLYLETTTYQPFLGIEEVCARFGPERLLFGTSFPTLEPGGAIARLTFAGCWPAAAAAIAGGNMARLLGLSWPPDGGAE
jgi:predicted TIM-barrel fold metal-dependent hydrolase